MLEFALVGRIFVSYRPTSDDRDRTVCRVYTVRCFNPRVGFASRLFTEVPMAVRSTLAACAAMLFAAGLASGPAQAEIPGAYGMWNDFRPSSKPLTGGGSGFNAPNSQPAPILPPHPMSPQQAKPKSKPSGKPVALMQGGPKPNISAQPPQIVSFSGQYAKGTVIVKQSQKKLYYVLGGGKAYVYPVAVGKEGFKWSGTNKVSRIAEWPDWTPPAEMRQRKPELPLKMTGGIYNPLGAKAIYLGSSLYRIHGTNDTKSIGTEASSGCIRMHNGHVVHLASLVSVGTIVHVVR